MIWVRWRALQAAAILGDRVAKRELEQMSENFYITTAITVVSVCIVVVIGLGLGHCNTTSAHEADRQSQLEEHAQKLRLEYVRKCVPPDMAERLAPTPVIDVRPGR